MVGQIHRYIMPAYLPLPTLRPASVEPMSDEESMSHQSWASKPRLFCLERNLHVRPHHNSAVGNCYGQLPAHSYRR